jgi:hypothetical protein
MSIVLERPQSSACSGLPPLKQHVRSRTFTWDAVSAERNSRAGTHSKPLKPRIQRPQTCPSLVSTTTGKKLILPLRQFDVTNLSQSTALPNRQNIVLHCRETKILPDHATKAEPKKTLYKNLISVNKLARLEHDLKKQDFERIQRAERARVGNSYNATIVKEKRDEVVELEIKIKTPSNPSTPSIDESSPHNLDSGSDNTPNPEEAEDEPVEEL